MHYIHCPWCGLRDESEFQYQGDATVKRPDDDAPIDAFTDYVYFRRNPKGPHAELWHHTGGCRRYLVVERNTKTHEIQSVRYAKPLEAQPAEEGETM